MSIIKYQVKENSSIGTHSFYGVAQSYSTLDFEDLADDVVEGLGISPSLVKTILDRYMLVAKRNVQRGHRVKLADVLTVYPQISCSVKDEVDKDGNVVKVATADMLNVATAKSSIGATISQAVQQSFASSVSWKRVSEKDVDEETTDPADPADTGGGNNSANPANPGGDNNSGNPSNTGGDNNSDDNGTNSDE